MEREVAGARGQHGLEDWMSHNEALVRARSGRLRQARMLWQRAIDFAKQTGDDERAAIYEAAEAVSEAQFGNGDEATREAEAALRLARNRDVEYAAAFALALAGDLPSAQRVFDDLRQRFPEDTCVQFEYLPVLRAQFALARGAPLDAVEHLQTALPYDFALPGTAFFAKFGALYPAYVRGEAYLAARRGHEAEMEFEKIFSHRGLVFADPIGALAHLQLGRAFMASGDRGKAKDAYRDFVTLWKDADPDIPILALARAEYATLQ